MNCSNARNLLHGYLDGELDLVHALAFEQHLDSCPDCRNAYQAQKALQSAIRASDLRVSAPDALRKQIQKRVRQANRPARLGSILHWRVSGLAALAATIVLLIWGSVSIWAAPDDDRLAQAVVDSHIRALMVDHLSDVVSSDKHTVKPWFDGKLDFAPVVDDLALQGFPLIGGRLDYLDNRPVAALIYRRQRHIINLFIWPETKPISLPFQTTRQGYQIMRWNQAGMNYWAVSDLNSDELKEFVQLIQQTTGP